MHPADSHPGHNSALVLYGFDARVPLDAPDPAWTEARRDLYLLNHATARPLSVDRAVWPPRVRRTPSEGEATDYQGDLNGLRQIDGPATLVGLAVLDDRDAARALLLPCRPSALDPAWLPLGWDVADTGLTSGISNCGFVPGRDDVEGLRRRFGPRLNAHGLFDYLADALEFRDISDARVPEHAPFLVHRIVVIDTRWGVRGTGG